MKRITMEHPFDLLLLLSFSLLLVFSFALMSILGNEYVKFIGWIMICITALTIIFSIIKYKKWPYRKYQVVCLDIDDNYQYFVILSDYTKSGLEKHVVKYINKNYTGIVLKEVVLVKDFSDEIDI